MRAPSTSTWWIDPHIQSRKYVHSSRKKSLVCRKCVPTPRDKHTTNIEKIQITGGQYRGKALATEEDSDCNNNIVRESQQSRRKRQPTVTEKDIVNSEGERQTSTEGEITHSEGGKESQQWGRERLPTAGETEWTVFFFYSQNTKYKHAPLQGNITCCSYITLHFIYIVFLLYQYT